MANCQICGKKALEPSPLRIPICHDCYQQGLRLGRVVIKTSAQGVIEPPRRLRRLLLPKYDELSLFLTSLLFILVCYYDAEFRSDAQNFLFKETEGDFLVAIPLLIGGIVYSLYHVFTSRPKTPTEKKLMLFVAVVTNGFSGIVAGLHMFHSAAGILLVFPVLNIISGVLLVFVWGCEVADGDHLKEEATLAKWVSDDNASWLAVVVASVALLALFAFCQARQLHWSLTCSICLACTTSIHGPLQRSLQLWINKRAAGKD